MSQPADETALNPYQSPQPADADSPHFASKAAKTAVLFLLVLVATHFLVDVTACIISPLWPSLEKHLNMAEGGVFWLFLAWTMTTSFTQLFFGYLGDRFQGRIPLWAGPVVAIVCLSCIGLTNSAVVTCSLLVVGGLGVAAFHPEAAAAAGACSPQHRSRVMSLFAIGGYFGQSAGPIYSGMMVDNYGMPGLAWGMVWGLAAIALLALGLRRGIDIAPAPTQTPISFSRLLRDNASSFAMILAIGTMRIVGAIGIPLALAFLLDSRGRGISEIGFHQSAFMAGIGSGGLACAFFVRPSRERRVLWFFPLVAAPVILAVPYAEGWLVLAAAYGSGFLIGAAMPVLISYGQQLLPEGQRIASSLTMGVSWGTGAAIVAAVMMVFKSPDTIAVAFWFFAAASVLSAVMSFWLPVVKEEE